MLIGKAEKLTFSSISYRKTLGDRLQLEEKVGALSVHDTTIGSKQVSFKLKKVSSSIA